MNNFNMDDMKAAVRSMGYDPDEFTPKQLETLWGMCVQKDAVHIEREMIERIKDGHE